MRLDKNCNTAIVHNKDDYVQNLHLEFLLSESCKKKVLMNTRRSNPNDSYMMSKLSQDEVRITEWNKGFFRNVLIWAAKTSISAKKTWIIVLLLLVILLLFLRAYFQRTKLLQEKELPACQPYNILIRPINSNRECLIKDAPFTCSCSEVQLRSNSYLYSTDSFIEVDEENPTVNPIPFVSSESKVDFSWGMSLKTESGTSYFSSLRGYSHSNFLHPVIRRKVVNFGFFGTVLTSFILVFMSPLNFIATYAALLSYGKVNNKLLHKYAPLSNEKVLPFRKILKSALKIEFLKVWGFVKWQWMRQFSNNSERNLEKDCEIDEKTMSMNCHVQIMTNLVKAYNWTGHVKEYKIPIRDQSSISSVYSEVSACLPDFLTEISSSDFQINHSMNSDFAEAISSSSDPISTQIQEYCVDSSQGREEEFQDKQFDCQKLTPSNSPNVPSNTTIFNSASLEYTCSDHTDLMDQPIEKAGFDGHHNLENSPCVSTSNSDQKVLPSQCSLEAIYGQQSSILVHGRVNTRITSSNSDDISFEDICDDLALRDEEVSILPNNDNEMSDGYSINTNIWIALCKNDYEEDYSTCKMPAKSFNGIYCKDKVT